MSGMNNKLTRWQSILRFCGSYGLGIVLMLILLALTFAGTLHEVRMAPVMGMDAAIESFFGAPWVLIPLGGDLSVISLPLPGMGITCALLFVNILIGGVLRVRRSWRNAGLIVCHVGILLLLGSVMLGNRLTVVQDRVELPQGARVKVSGLPFELMLNKFTPEFYPGTDKPKSFESLLTVYPERGGEYRAAVRMNEPLRLNGWTLYQMSYGQDSLHPGRIVSVLRASHNPLEQMPKWSSYVIALGLVWHFALVFVRYLSRRTEAHPAAAEQGAEQGEEVEQGALTTMTEAPATPVEHTRLSRLRLVGIIIAVLAVFGIGLMAARPSVQTVEVPGYTPWSPELKARIAAMAVQDGGRIKPVSTYAGFHLLRTLGKRSFSIATPAGKLKLDAVDWMIDCLFRPELADQYPVFLVNREDVVSKLNLPPQPDKRKKYTYAQLLAHWDDIAAAVNEIRRLGDAPLTDAQKEIVALSRNMDVVSGWRMYAPLMIEDPAALTTMEFPRWFAPNSSDSAEAATSAPAWTAVPDKKTGAFLAMGSLLERKALTATGTARADMTAKSADIIAERLIEPNERAVAALDARATLDREILYYRIDPLYPALAAFIGGFVCLLVCSLFRGAGRRSSESGPACPWWRRVIRPGGFSPAWVLGALGAAVLVTALVLRTLITLRSPVGNTYETIAFIACAGVLCALVAELFSKKGIVLAAGLILGAFACQMGVMYESSRAVDHMDPLVAILRSNFLLSTHVITIVLGYAAGLLAAVLSHVYLIAAPLKLTGRKTVQSLDRIAYGILCFSLVFTLVGTVFGGIWGNESWGRFWGWDPKENGALMIVLWQLCLLHARKAGWLNSWALHFGNVLGGLIIAFAWWGVNMLGIGLHSYGFTGAQSALTVFYWIELALCLTFIILRIKKD